MKEKEKKNTIVKRMIFAVAAGFVVGFLMLFLREFLLESGKSGIWKTVDAIFFQDVTKTNGIEGIGILYIVGQLFMRGLQLAIVPLVLTSLSLAMCSLANPERLGKIAGRHLSHLLLCSGSGSCGSSGIFCENNGMVRRTAS